MRIIKTNHLEAPQKEAVRALEREAFQEDGLENTVFLENELNVDRAVPCFYLGYEGDRLAAFLTVFFPSREDGEINAFTHPELRRQGRFTALYREAAAEMRAAGIGQAVFAVEPKSVSGTAALAQYPGARLLRSEYRMARRGKDTPPLREGLHVLPLTPETREEYLSISQKAYEDEGPEIVDSVIRSETRKGYLLCGGTGPVGVFGLENDGGRVFLYGVAVAEEERNRGLGREIVYCALREGERRGVPVVLDVDSENPPALHLYRACGFETVFQVDYYAHPWDRSTP